MLGAKFMASMSDVDEYRAMLDARLLRFSTQVERDARETGAHRKSRWQQVTTRYPPLRHGYNAFSIEINRKQVV